MTNPRRTVAKTLLVLVVLLFVALHAFVWYEGRAIVLPPYEEVEVQWPEQNWTPDDWQWFYHASQGGAFGIVLPYEWLMALEQPRLHPLVFKAVPRFMEKDYISRFGFLPNDVTRYDPDNLSIKWAVDTARTAVYHDAANNPDKLPVGFVKTGNFPNPITARSEDVIGFTCAACHTGQLNHNGVGIRIEGGPALTNLTKFEKAIGLSLAMTTLFPFRFNRFANTVLPEDHTASDRDRLKTALKSTFRKGKAYKELIEKENIYPTEEGFGRLDALGRIGNFVFGSEIDKKNYVESNAPVNYPHIWDTPWFDWVQYNGSIKQPLVRNAGEAMGVFAKVNFDPHDTTTLFSSTINFTNLYEMEQLIRGETALSGLQSPKWPEDVFGEIDREKAKLGKDLYIEHCQYCHMPPKDESDRLLFGYGEDNWTEPDSLGNRYLNLKMVNLYTVGTDPNTAVNFAQRIVQLGNLGEMARDKDTVWAPKGVGGITTAGVALPFLVDKTIEKGLNDLGVTGEARARMRGYRPNEIQAPMAYMARPLNGVWATAPFLHNGAVPNLYQLLSPLAERDKKFYLGSKEFDPKHVGLSTEKVKGGFEFDTSHPGNSNKGHQFEYEGDIIDPNTFEWWALPKGVIGPKLTEDERWAIIEFLKTQ